MHHLIRFRETREKSIEEWKKQNPSVPVTEVPIDLVTNSGSGLDPDISRRQLLAGGSHIEINEYSERKT